MSKNKKGIFWLASYPKSGNTWFRAFLTNLRRKDLSQEYQEADINNLDRTPIASARQLFDQACGVMASELLPRDIENLRPRVYESLAKNLEENLYLKIHDAYFLTQNNEPMVSKKATKGALYILRNPLDVAVSFAHHNHISMDQMILGLESPKYALAKSKRKLSSQLTQKLLSWKAHVESWVHEPEFPVHVMRYEDMKANPVKTFWVAAQFLELEEAKNIENVRMALGKCKFEKLQKQEKDNKFREKPSKAQKFFRKGKVGSWREELTPKQAQRLIDFNYSIMKRFGYVDEKGQVSC